MQKGYIVVIFSHSGTSTDCFSCLAVPTRIYLCKGDAILAMGFEQFMLFFSKFNIQYSISLKQIVSLSLQARHNTITHVFFRCTLYQSILERGLGAKGSEST